MVFKVVLFVCAQALMMQSIAGECWGWAPEYACRFAPSSGGSLPINSESTYAPRGVALQSENSYEGKLDVRGALPFLGTVGLEGILPTAGSAAVQYGCGNGEVAMLSENYAAPRCGCGRAY